MGLPTPSVSGSVNVVLAYIVTLGERLISKHHNVFQYNADAAATADARCVCSLTSQHLEFSFVLFNLYSAPHYYHLHV